VSEAGACGELASVRCPLPLDPTVMLDGVIAPECGVFKSALSPLRLTFRTLGAGAPGRRAQPARGSAASLLMAALLGLQHPGGGPASVIASPQRVASVAALLQPLGRIAGVRCDTALGRASRQRALVFQCPLIAVQPCKDRDA